MLSIFLLPYSLYLSLAYWIYPLKDYIGDTGCYVAIYGRDIGNYITQTHSFFVAMFRYNCLFNGTILNKINFSPNVSLCFKPLVNPKQLQQGLKKCGPQRYTVLNWIPKHLRYMDFDQTPCRYMVLTL